jgi:hypothetical protein
MKAEDRLDRYLRSLPILLASGVTDFAIARLAAHVDEGANRRSDHASGRQVRRGRHANRRDCRFRAPGRKDVGSRRRALGPLRRPDASVGLHGGFHHHLAVASTDKHIGAFNVISIPSQFSSFLPGEASGGREKRPTGKRRPAQLRRARRASYLAECLRKERPRAAVAAGSAPVQRSSKLLPSMVQRSGSVSRG